MKQHDDKQMYALYKQWLLSGQSRAFFAKEHGVRATTFYYWAKKFQKESLMPPGPKQKGGFSRLAVEEPIPVDKRQVLAVISFPSGVSVELYSPVAACFLKELSV